MQSFHTELVSNRSNNYCRLFLLTVLFVVSFFFLKDENAIIWYSGSQEKQLNLNQVSKIIPGQRTVSSYGLCYNCNLTKLLYII